MENKLIGLRFSGDVPLEQSAGLMRMTMKVLAEDFHATFDRLLFPYADTLLLSDGAEKDRLFGTHALLAGFDADTLAEAVFSAIKRLRPSFEEASSEGVIPSVPEPAACELEYDREAIASFLSQGVREDNHEYIGDFASLLSVDVHPWDIRETSRKLCSFCEQAARTEGVVLHGLMGGSVCADVDPEAIDTIIRLYHSKTGGKAVN